MFSSRETRTSIVIDVFSAFLKPVIPQLNLCSAHSVHSPNFTLKCSCTFNFIFYTKLNTVSLDSLFRIVKNRRAHHNTSNLFICQKQTDNPKWLILSTYITDVRTNQRVAKRRVDSRHIIISHILSLKSHCTHT